MAYYNGGNYRDSMTQDRSEIAMLAQMLRREGVTSLLEVGSRFGGSIWYLAHHLPHGSRVVAIDSGQGEGGNKPGQVDSLRECMLELSKKGYDAHLIVGWSQAAAVVEMARQLGPFDAVFIDADHSYSGVKTDWENYGAMSVNIVAFHDVAWKRYPHFPKSTKEVEVPKLWAELASQFQSQAFVNESANMGIGVLRK